MEDQDREGPPQAGPDPDQTIDAAAAAAPPNPYVGPRPFFSTEQAKFYGREREVAEIRDLLIAERVVWLYAPSGAGKTSLIQAALIPKLAEEDFRVLPIIRVNAPLPDGLAAGPVNRFVLSTLLSLERRFPEEKRRAATALVGPTLLDYLGDPLAEPGDTASEVLIFDQFEEILTIEPLSEAGWRARTEFFAQVGATLADRRRWALFALREDHLAAFDPYLNSIPTRLDHRYRLDLLQTGAALRAIRLPAALRPGGDGRFADFTQPAATMLVANLSAGRYVEPVQLQVVCTRFWDRLPWAALPIVDDRRQIEPGHVAELARVDNALADYYAEKVAAIAAATAGEAPAAREREIREWIEANLITERGTRAQLRVGAERDQTLPSEAIAGLIDAYLVRREGRPGDDWYELAHDRLVSPIRDSNAAWLPRHLQPVQLQARQWDETRRRRELLLGGNDLRLARRWTDANLSSLPGWEQTLLTDFLDASEQGERTQRLRRWVFALGALVGLLLVAIAVFEFVRSAAEARDQAETEATRTALEFSSAATRAALENSAEATRATSEERAQRATSLLLANQAEDELAAGELDLALLLATEAVDAGETREARRILLAALTSQPGLTAILGRQTSAPSAVAISPDGAMAASAGCAQEAFGCALGEIRLWDLVTRRPLGSLPGPSHRGDISALAFTPDGRTLASGGDDRTVMLWDLQTRQPLGQPLVGHQREVLGVAFSLAGRTLASGDASGTILLWDVLTRQPLGESLTGHLGQVTRLAFDPGGALASGGADGTVLIWHGGSPRLRCNLAGGVGTDCVAVAPEGTPSAGRDAGGTTAAPAPPPGPAANGEAAIRSLGFSPDGRWLAAAAANGAVAVWDVGSGRQPVPFVGQTTAVLGLGFSPDGATLAAVGQDRTMTRWSVATGQSILRIEGTGDFTAAAFGADGVTLVAGDRNGEVSLWDLARPIPLAQRFAAGGPVLAVALAADGQALAAGTAGGRVDLWDVRLGDSVPRRLDQPGAVTAIAVAPAGQTILAAGQEGEQSEAGDQGGQIVLWDVLTGEERLRLTGDIGPVNALAAAPDGRILATGGEDGTIRLWEIATGNEVRRIEGHAGAVHALAISPDGRALASSGADSAVRLWDIATGERLLDLPGHTGQVYGVAFSPDGKTVASAGGDGSVIVWGVAGGERVANLAAGRSRLMYAVAFSPDGTTLAAAASDQQIYLWDVATYLEVGQLSGHTQPVRALSFAADGALASGGEDATVLVWSLDATALRETACRIANRNLSQEEWTEFMLNEAYRWTCADLPIGEIALTAIAAEVPSKSEMP